MINFIPYHGQFSGAEIDALLSRITTFGGLFQGTTSYWNSTPSRVSVSGAIYVYTDYATEDQKNIPGIKIGDGNAYVVDLPFVMTGVAITQADIDSWNNKVGARIDPNNPENLVLYK